MSIPDKTTGNATYAISFKPTRTTTRLAQAGGSRSPIGSTSASMRLVYVLALLASVVPLGRSGWVSLAMGAGSWAGVALVIVVALAIYRVVLVLTRPDALDAPVAEGIVHWCRVLGVGMACIGLVIFALNFFIGPIGHALFPRGSDNGVEFFVIGLWLALLGGLTPVGLLLFEFSRMQAFEHWLRKERA